MGQVTDRHRVTRVTLGAAGAHPEGGQRRSRPDTLAVEEPLEIRVGAAGRERAPLAVTMRTPGHDLELALGFLFTEGVVRDADDVTTAQVCAGPEPVGTGPVAVGEDPQGAVGSEAGYNVVNVVLAPDVPPPAVEPGRNFYTTSSCGVCGKASIDAVRLRSRHPVAGDPVRVAAATVAALPARLRRAQRGFDRTGGLHAAGLFTPSGELVTLREDVGRHNALDKLIGWAVRQRRVPLREGLLLVSGRASFELVQKAWLAGAPLLAAVSAPSTLAVRLAGEAGMTLVGFVRGETMNIYTRPDRVT